MLNNKESTTHNQVQKILKEDRSDISSMSALFEESPENDFSGFYTSLVPYSDLMTLLLIFFVFFYLVRDSELGWKTISEAQQKVIAENQVAVDSTEYSAISDLNERVISVPGEILFESGKAELRWNSHKPLLKIAQSIEQTVSDGGDWSIRIEGHTDNIPIANSKYPSNWELSTARALSIVKFFLRNSYFTPDQLQIMGYGEFKPLVPNDSPANREKNRRVEIKLSKKKDS